MLNKITLIGRLAFDPEPRGKTPDKPIAHLRLAVDRDYSRDGEPKTDFFDVSAFGKQSETLVQYARKGHLLCVVGTLQCREWPDKKTGEKRSGVEIKMSDFYFLEKKKKDAEQGNAQRPIQNASMPPAPCMPAGGYAAPPQSFQTQGMPMSMPMAQPATMPQPMATGMPPAPAHMPAQSYPPFAGYGTPDFSGVPESYAFGPNGATDDVPF